MENIITRSCEQFGTIRQIKGTPNLWCGSDVAKALGYANTRKAIIDHCKGVTKRDIPHPQSQSKQISKKGADLISAPFHYLCQWFLLRLWL